ncbi:NUDIX domain-containing protein [Silvanigrella aquatica]|uniref:Cytidyltransferase-like domain-containing protein n=1 Tax=Silvanigrella aquatica TaxID=1915309 RepID=A0A1L4D1Q2_9BACT|nr:NUDIX domain-containing protein [Silvanigrella aquatica]APJ04127.1 hypothetical protein AXG55_09505 [Silvanigrella aquatica]
MGKMPVYRFEVSVVIGRFQPFHNGHLKTLQFAMAKSKKIIIILGGYMLSAGVRGPWSAEERTTLIRSCFSPNQLKRISFVYVRDRLYDEKMWIDNVKGEVSKIMGDEKSVALIGHEKDSSSYYLRVFPEWEFLETGNYDGINATDIRNIYFLSRDYNKAYNFVPKIISLWLKKYRKTEHFRKLKSMYSYVHKISKNQENNLPHNVANAVVFCMGYVLLVKAKDPLRKGFYSLPEYIIKDNDNRNDCALRAIENESKFNFTAEKLELNFKLQHIFDYADRFPICKQKSFSKCYQLNLNSLPAVAKGKNIEKVEWVLINDVYLREDQMYADHYQIIQWFLKNLKN